MAPHAAAPIAPPLAPPAAMLAAPIPQTVQTPSLRTEADTLKRLPSVRRAAELLDATILRAHPKAPRPPREES